MHCFGNTAGRANKIAVTMQVSFTGELDQDTDWRVFHEPHANRFHIEIGKPSVGIH
ncbi:MAG: hypothetical protein VCA35_06125 [Roseibacillus sp.]